MNVEGLQAMMRKFNDNDEILKLSLFTKINVHYIILLSFIIILISQSTDQSGQLIISVDIWISLCLPRNITLI